MSSGYRRARAVDAARAFKLAKAAEARERWPREQLLAHQRERIDAVVRHAAAASAFHGERYAGLLGPGPVELGHLPAVTKAEVMDAFDSVVTDRRLRRDELLAHAEQADGDNLYLDGYRVITTSGSTGRKGVFVWDRPAWAALLGGFLRFTTWAGSTPRLPRRRRLVYLGPTGGTHMSRRMVTSMSIGVHRMTVVPVTTPLEEIVATLNAIRPDTLAGFPSMVALVGREQLAGRLHITPDVVTCSSEVLTPEMRAVVEEAFGVPPFDGYAATETGFIGGECPEHHRMHVYEDLVAIEPVDAGGTPVPDGQTGAQLLVTSLVNHVQPTIRLAISDRVAIDPEPCPCGRPFATLRGVEGREDDVLRLQGTSGEVQVHPLHFATIAKAREVREFQVVQEGLALRIRIALANGDAAEDVQHRLAAALDAELRRAGVAEPNLSFEFCRRIERDPKQMGKLKLIVADRR